MADRKGLTRDRIVEAAIRLLNAHGAKDFSMRLLAAELAVDPMAVYRHLANKQAVIHAVLEAMVAEVELPAVRGDWRDRVRAICQSYRGLAARHPGVFPLLYPYPRSIQSERAVEEALYAALLDAGLPAPDVVKGATMLLNYAAGFGLDEVTGWLAPPDGAEREALSALPSDRFPATERVRSELAGIDHDGWFEFGLDVLLDGLSLRTRRDNGDGAQLKSSFTARAESD